LFDLQSLWNDIDLTHVTCVHEQPKEDTESIEAEHNEPNQVTACCLISLSSTKLSLQVFDVVHLIL